ncbi:MAG: phosphoglycerate kinase [Patescibacteria group bacterium]|nr:phosphoglycerate kinase [Patescibacteria group bacterium]
MSYLLPLIKNADVKGKTVLLRLDLDVPIVQLKIQNSKSEIKIEDKERLESGLATIRYLTKHGAEIIIAGHLGRPEGKDENFSLRPVAKWFARKVGYSQIHPRKFGIFNGWRLTERISILENLRFFKGEERDDKQFSKELASLADVYINDAFAVSHRTHASIVGVPAILPHFAGIHFAEEVEILGNVLKRPKRPLIVIIGGAKLETKLPLVEKMHRFADYVLIGGKIARETRVLLKVAHEKIYPQAGRKRSVLLIADSNFNGTDISEKSVENFCQIVVLAKTIIWNGPMGIIKNSEFSPRGEAGRIQNSEDTEKGTRKLAKAITESKAYSIVGGGDTLAYLKKIDLLNKFDFCSMGGGAMLSFLAGEKMPGIEVLEK